MRSGAPPSWGKFDKTPVSCRKLLNSPAIVARRDRGLTCPQVTCPLTPPTPLVAVMGQEIVLLGQDSSASTPLIFGAGCVGSCPVLWGASSSVPDPTRWAPATPLPVVADKNIPDVASVP